MPRISGIELPDEKRIEAGLAVLYGIGRKNVFKVLSEARIQPGKKIKDLTSEEVARLQKIIDQYPVEGSLRKKISDDINRLKTIGCYRGTRHIKGLPVRGQRTRSNARVKRGKRKTIGALKKKDLSRQEKVTGEKNE